MQPATAESVAPLRTSGTGLTAAEVAQRVADGRTNTVDANTGRSVGEIVRNNVLTPFNALLATLWAFTLASGRWQNAAFGGVIVANSAIGIFQELRAKRTLDRLAVLNAPHARAIRDGVESEIAVGEIVADDLLVLRSGDQVPADGIVRASSGLECDESLLTGESEPIDKNPEDEVRSGAIVVAGSGTFQATKVGAEAYAAQLAAEAKRFQITHSELVSGTNKLLRWIACLMLVVGPLVLWSQFRSTDNHGWQDAVEGTVGALVGMVPEGLVLLTSVAFMLGTLTLARRQTLVQELPAVEGLARVDVVCLDKTGTLTHGDVQFDRLEILGDADEGEVNEALGLLNHTGEANATANAVAAVISRGTWTATDSTAFSSARKWSSVTAGEHGTWVFGAPEMIIPMPQPGAEQDARSRTDAIANEGRRVLLLTHDEVPAAVVVLAENIRDDAAETLRYFTEQGVALKVISGDNPRTVGAVAAKVGVPGVNGADDAIDARTLPEDIDELGEVLEHHSVFGRVTPQQKRAVVAALQKKGHVVAMTGDGVNDALALKDADIGVAMGNGSPATRAVAQLVLLDGKFSHLPDVVAEGRRVIANIERASNLFIVKNVYSLVQAIITVITLSAFPLAPIQLTLISSLTIGIPGFFLALGPNRRRYLPGFLGRVIRFALPVGAVTGGLAYLAFVTARELDKTPVKAVGGSYLVEGARTSATVALLVISLWTVLVLARPLVAWKLGLVAAMAFIAAIVVVVPGIGHGLFLLEMTPKRLIIGLIFGAVGAAAVELTHRIVRAISTRR
ncbi:MAG TPA: HAD-IC family P-type ATPase [Jatrophihabitans sp.]